MAVTPASKLTSLPVVLILLQVFGHKPCFMLHVIDAALQSEQEADRVNLHSDTAVHFFPSHGGREEEQEKGRKKKHRYIHLSSPFRPAGVC